MNEIKKYTNEQVEKYRKNVKLLCHTYPDNFSRMLKTTQQQLHQFILWYTRKMNDKNHSLATLCYWTIEGITDWNDLRVRCPTCGKPLKDKEAKVLRGYIRPHCSRSCSQADPAVFKKLVEKKKKKYGSANNSIKTKYTLAKKSFAKICQNKYETILFTFQEFQQYYINKKHIFSFMCNKCGRKIHQRLSFFKINGKHHLCRCYHCFPSIHTRSKNEIQIYDFCYKICKKQNLNIINNDRTLININGKSREFDIHIPELKFLIEFDGSYYHSEEFIKLTQEQRIATNKSIIRKIDKTIIAENLGYELLHINEDDWLNETKQTEIKKYLEAKLTKKFVFNLANKIEYVNREIHNKNDIPIGYHLINEIEPQIELRLEKHVFNCGFLVYEKD